MLRLCPQRRPAVGRGTELVMTIGSVPFAPAIMTPFTIREQIVELVNRLFVYTDQQQWLHLQEEVFTREVLFDLSQAGGGAAGTVSSRSICDGWAQGFSGIDAVHHLVGNHLVSLDGEAAAEITCYATATHYRADAEKGPLREFVGSYRLHAVRTEHGWRLDRFAYQLKYVTGNTRLD
jgi:hypothetical protein